MLARFGCQSSHGRWSPIRLSMDVGWSTLRLGHLIVSWCFEDGNRFAHIAYMHIWISEARPRSTDWDTTPMDVVNQIEEITWSIQLMSIRRKSSGQCDMTMLIGWLTDYFWTILIDWCACGLTLWKNKRYFHLLVGFAQSTAGGHPFSIRAGIFWWIDVGPNVTENGHVIPLFDILLIERERERVSLVESFESGWKHWKSIYHEPNCSEHQEFDRKYWFNLPISCYLVRWRQSYILKLQRKREDCEVSSWMVKVVTECE